MPNWVSGSYEFALLRPVGHVAPFSPPPRHLESVVSQHGMSLVFWPSAMHSVASALFG